MITVNNAPDKSAIQGLILRGYTHPFSCHLLVNFPANTLPSAKQAFFCSLYPLVQNAEDWGANKPPRMLNIGLTFTGIKQLNILAQSDLDQFPSDFQSGPWSDQSQASLSDYGGSAPSTWWKRNFFNQDLHCVVHAYALTQSNLDILISDITNAIHINGLKELFPLEGSQGRLTQYPLPNDEIHFGYRDGISEPLLTWSGETPADQDQGDLANFLIGYSPGTSLIQPGPTTGSAGSFAFNGCYNAFRILYQDVATFNKLLQDQTSVITPIIGGTPDDAQEWLAAKLMGRWRNGSPLILSPNTPDPATEKGELFSYTESADTSRYKDVLSTNKCPYSAHTRVANPRDEHLTPIEGATPPRIVRRGMPYGPTVTGTADDGIDRGLIGLFLCGSFSRQFEKIYGWMNTNNFASDLAGLKLFPQDAVLGNRNPNKLSNQTTSFTIPVENEEPIIINQLPLMIQTRAPPTVFCPVSPQSA